MRVWILAKREKFETYENLRFQEAAQQMGISLTLVAPEDCEILATGCGRKSIYIEQQEVDELPDCFIPRTGSGTTYFASAVMRHMERLGVFVLNTHDSVALAMDKMASIQTLSSNSLPIPKTILAKFPLDLELIDKEFTYPVIIKKLSGSHGTGIALCQDRSQLDDTAGFVGRSSNAIIQECIEDSIGRDIRVFVVGGRAIGAMIRTAKTGSFKANYSAGGSVCRVELTPEMEWLALESARIVGLDIAGVDLLFDRGGYRICEVNSSPYFMGFEEATGIDIPTEIFNFVRVRLERSQQAIVQQLPRSAVAPEPCLA
ncbi:RimK family alpha-L-glutamate ligase [Candidatus Peregrinibacteria bacterium CG10_big_fil_rev_8_21_14_0_10_49_24]|nr:MAG: alpha-L-glutamate ligase [Candidatus Peregrinibacteria bacterium CG11_big_fil_rev_8_21_14_0_20_49_14]PIR50534.1 MAG: RimK family alpha-L-glutamate ligase [Candidatus Peregrinibacteria bacterium CG10_big_fil_rev_8_21_14_0_10_49_24]PJA67903.1 MAG: RimK family alpha-L-glutamate ligase [Candidatus Peregrinibacteria bacterium CG_4_9_14_3_um_filter_49_12]